MRALRATVRFARDFVIGDDPKLAAGVGIVLLAGAVVLAASEAGGGVLAPILAIGFIGAFTAAVLIDARGG
jgi:hypothetical protein